MSSVQKLLDLIDDFVGKCSGDLNSGGNSIHNPLEVYYTAHAYHKVLTVFEKEEHIKDLKERLSYITETILENEK